MDTQEGPARLTGSEGSMSNHPSSIREKIEAQRAKIEELEGQIDDDHRMTCPTCRESFPPHHFRISHDGNQKEHILCRGCSEDLRDAGYPSAPFKPVMDDEIQDAYHELERLERVQALIQTFADTGKNPRWGEKS